MPIKLKKGSLFFAPMEGITDQYYRNMIFKNYPDWDYMACDFLRIPRDSIYPDKHLIKHFGQIAYEQPQQKNKTLYQILTSEGDLTQLHIEKIHKLGFDWIDINLGCPSKTVCKNKGGSFLLSEPETLKGIIKVIRSSFPGTFTAKIRVGYRDDSNFLDIIKLLEDEGVDAITVHARTRDELYKGMANWDYIKQAVKAVNIPIIGNGDIWSLSDIDRYYDYTDAHSIMMARGALKTPWLAKLYKKGLKEESLEFRVKSIKEYFKFLYDEIDQSQKLNELGKIRRLKSVSRNIFDPLPNFEQTKKSFLLSKTHKEIFDVIENISI